MAYKPCRGWRRSLLLEGFIASPKKEKKKRKEERREKKGVGEGGDLI